MEFVIEVEDLRVILGGAVILNGISLRIAKGESYVIIGESGTGKSVLVKCILGLIKPTSGTIKINGRDLNDLTQKEMLVTLLRCGVLFQGGALFDSMNVIDNVTFGLVYGYGKPVKEAYKVAVEKLESVGLSPKIAKVFPAELSGGMRKRVALARAIATNPDIIFFDEPTSGLDPITSAVISELIVQCTKGMGISALSITHDMKSLRHISDVIGLLHQGKKIWEGTKEEIDSTDNPYVRQFVAGATVGPFTHATHAKTR
ncbi:MAG: ATP-binding cassette domain-containing protein [Holosporales bacterium]|jgi:phospholipid/cholesterol/gamma-HCH transport system ATP-binding protein|nr:ATP-binding cassette domain-containing protein [Holosporales bacterium]